MAQRDGDLSARWWICVDLWKWQKCIFQLMFQRIMGWILVFAITLKWQKYRRMELFFFYVQHFWIEVIFVGLKHLVKKCVELVFCGVLFIYLFYCGPCITDTADLLQQFMSKQWFKIFLHFLLHFSFYIVTTCPDIACSVNWIILFFALRVEMYLH